MEDIGLYIGVGIFAILFLFLLIILVLNILYSAIYGCLIKGHDLEIIDQKEQEAFDINAKKVIPFGKVYICRCKRCGEIIKNKIIYQDGF